MSTRAVYRFIDAGVTAKSEHIQVYIHSDGYPTWAWNYFDAVFQAKNMWELPRFEADEFAAAFIAANKDRPGGVRCMNAGDKNLPGDIEYLYTLQPESGAGPKSGFSSDPVGDLMLTVYTCRTDAEWKNMKRRQIWRGTVQQFIAEKGELCGDSQ